jgi:hypothetical protein
MWARRESNPHARCYLGATRAESLVGGLSPPLTDGRVGTIDIGGGSHSPIICPLALTLPPPPSCRLLDRQ